MNVSWICILFSSLKSKQQQYVIFPTSVLWNLVQKPKLHSGAFNQSASEIWHALVTDKRQRGKRENKWNTGVKLLCFSSCMVPLLLSTPIIHLSHIFSTSQTYSQLSGYVWGVVSEQPTLDWPLDKGVQCPELK